MKSKVLHGVLLMGLFFGLFGCGVSSWEKLDAAGTAAYEQGRYAEAEKSWSAALQKAEKFGPQDTRLAQSLNDLAVLYRNQGKYGEAEPLYKRALAIREKSLGPDHPDVARNLENYAELLLKTNRKTEAARLEARAKAIRAKQK